MKQPLVTQISEDALKYVLSLPTGRKVLWDILGIAGLYRQPRVAGDTEGTAFNCGALNVALAIYADCLTVSPELTAMMTKEQATYDNRDPSEPARRDYSDPSARSTDLGSEPELPAELRVDRRTGQPFVDRPRERDFE